MSDPLRRLFEASSPAEVGRLLRENPGEIAKAIGVESVPALTVSLIAMAALGPVVGAVTLTGTSAMDGYAKGLVGALARAGVDVSDAAALTRALQDKALMERIRKDATTDGAIEAGVTAAAMMIGVRRSRAATRTKAKTPNASPHTMGGTKVAAQSAPPSIAGDPPPGSFSISDWSAYPDAIVTRPQGPFRIVQGLEYVAESIAKKRANAALRRKQGLGGQPVDVHERHPVKFGGSPTDPANKVILPRDDHRQVTKWWNKLKKELDTNVGVVRPMVYSLTEGQLDPPADPGVVEALSSSLKVALPLDYLDFLRQHNGGEGFIGDNYIIFWKAEELADFNREYEVDKYAPGLVLFGSDGGGDGYGFDTRSAAMPIVCVPFIGMELRYATPVAKNFPDFFAQLAVPL